METETVSLLRLIIGLLIAGIIFGALGRLVIPGPNPLSIGVTILAGIGGSVLGTLAAVLLAPVIGSSQLAVFVLQVLGAALIVYALSRRPRRRRF